MHDMSTSREPASIVKSILAHKHGKQEERLFDCRFLRYNPDYPSKKAIHDILDNLPDCPNDIEEILENLGQQGGVDAAFSGLAWFVEKWGLPRDKRFYDVVLTACRDHHDCEKAFETFKLMKDGKAQADMITYNLLISTCASAGKRTKAFDLFHEMLDSGLKPNSFTIRMLLQVCNFRNCGDYEPAMYAFCKLTECEDVNNSQDLLVEDLYRVCESALRNSDRWQEAMKVFLGLHELGIERNPRIFNGLLDACARDRNHRKVGCGELDLDRKVDNSSLFNLVDVLQALEVFAYMLNTGVLPDTDTYNALINACVREGEIMKALRVFEWMVEGRGAQCPVPVNEATFKSLLGGCHRKAMIEKALEIMSWMTSSGLELDVSTYDEVIHCGEVAQLWDEKVMKPVVKGIAVVPPERLRPSPFNGMRMLYTDNPDKVLEDTLMSLEKLGEGSWAPPEMRLPQTDPRTMVVLANKLVIIPWTRLSREHRQNMSRKLTPNLKASDARSGKSQRFSTKGALDWARAPTTGRTPTTSRTMTSRFPIIVQK